MKIGLGALWLVVAVGILWEVLRDGDRPSSTERRSPDSIAAPDEPPPTDGSEVPEAPVPTVETPPAEQAPSEPPEPAEPSEDPPEESEAPDHDRPDMPQPEEAGPLEVLKPAFERSKRDPGASKAEAEIRGLFGDPELPRETLVALTCREVVCRATVEWSKKDPYGYMAATMRIGHEFNPNIAVAPTGEPDADGVMQVDLYVLREGYELSDLE